MPDDATAHLIFASDQANHNFARVLGDLRRAQLAISHRLRSIRHDAAFVARVADHYGVPVVANERCGTWYVRPPAPLPTPSLQGTASRRCPRSYFKSTDGHTGQWSFSTRRLNLHLLPLAGRHGCFVLVDSTRRGKRMPDALSKTVPFWCCVINRALFAGDGADGGDGIADAPDLDLFTPPSAVSASEHSQMRARLPGAVDSLRRLGVLDGTAPASVSDGHDDGHTVFGHADSGQDAGHATSGHDAGHATPGLDAWRRCLHNKPLRPVWVTPDMAQLPDVGALRDRFNVIVCCTASRVPDSSATARVEGDAATDSFSYIQGAADDTENWAHGLTSDLFWAHLDELLATPESELPAFIASLQSGARTTAPADTASTITTITPFLSVGIHSAATPLSVGVHAVTDACQIVFLRQTTDAAAWAQSPTLLQVGLGKQDKAAGRQLRYALPQICAFASAYLGAHPHGCHIRVLCDTGRDLSVGTALALLCACFDEAGQPMASTDTPLGPARRRPLNKEAIRVRLARIMAAMPQANPSRTTLQSVNSFLLE